MSNPMNFSNALKEFLVAEILPESGATVGDLTEESDLATTGIIDSLAILKLIAFIEEKWGIRISDSDVTLENFRTLGDLARLVAAKAPR